MPNRLWTDLGDPDDLDGLLAHVTLFLEWLGVRHYSEETTQTRRKHLRPFLSWCREQSITRPGAVTRQLVEDYQLWLYRYQKVDGDPLDAKTQHGMLVTVRMFFKWLTRSGRIPFNPTSELELPKSGQRLPKDVLTPAEVEQVLAVPVVTQTLGLRNRAIFETAYSTGLRRRELSRILLRDVVAARGVVFISKGKGDKDRVTPIGDRALAWIARYLKYSRPKLARNPAEDALFLTRMGNPFNPNYLTALATKHIAQANLGKRGSCHAFRHAMATAMLENGADIRFIQEILGHAKVTSTAIYTHVAIGKLRQVHAATHPTAKLQEPLADAPMDDDPGRRGDDEG